MGICKLTIKTYEDNTFGSEKGEFITTINPTNLRIYNDVVHSRFNTLGNNNFGIRFNSIQPRTMSFSLLFDNTGVFQNSEAEVKKQLDALESLLIQYKENINEPYYIRVIWGNIDFKGKLSKMTTDYTSFKNDGTPIRAQIDIKIIECIQQITNATTNNESKSDENNDKDTNENKNDNKDNNTEKKQAENKVEDENNNKDEEKKDENGENKDDENKDEENKENENEENKDEENKDEENKDDENKNEENKDENGSNDDIEDVDNTKTAEVEVKAKDSLPSVSRAGFSALGLSGSNLLNSIKNGLALVGAFNLLDTLRKLAKGFVALVKKIWDLLKKLIKKAIALIKRGITFIKKKVSAAISKIKNWWQKVKEKFKKSKNKVKNKINNVNKNGKSLGQKMKDGFNGAKGNIKNRFNRTKSKIRNKGS